MDSNPSQAALGRDGGCRADPAQSARDPSLWERRFLTDLLPEITVMECITTLYEGCMK